MSTIEEVLREAWAACTWENCGMAVALFAFGFVVWVIWTAFAQ